MTVESTLCLVSFNFEKNSYVLKCEEAVGFAKALKATKNVSLLPFSNVTTSFSSIESNHGFFSSKWNHGLSHHSIANSLAVDEFIAFMKCAENCSKSSSADWDRCIVEKKINLAEKRKTD